MAFNRNRLHWPVVRTVRSLRVYVVEPYSYSPGEHAALFSAALESLLSPPTQEVWTAHTGTIQRAPETFDLLTFPEAFLPAADLLTAFPAILTLPSCGCVHVGLRPTADVKQHLFTVSEIEDLVRQMRTIPQLEHNDIDPFSNWLGRQSSDRMFNIGCLFTIDAEQKLRVCLHPKIVKSKFETGMLHELNMSEADLLTLVTLVPTDKRFLTITLQPLLCSDALNLDTDRPNGRPLYAVNSDDGGCFGDECPDHVDIVSLATCTPQPTYGAPSVSYMQWHPAFQDTFIRAARDDELLKHHQAVFVLSNFHNIPPNQAGGLSGAFMPISFAKTGIPPFLAVSVWGQPTEYSGPEQWSISADALAGSTAWDNLGYIASLKNSDHETSGRMISFTITKLPRQTSRWRSPSGLTDFQLFVASQDKQTQRLTFKRQVF